MFRRGGVRGLILTAGVGVQAAFECHVVGEKLKRNEMNEGSKPSGAFGDHKSLLGGNVAICGRDYDGRAQRFQLARGAENRVATVVTGTACQQADDCGAGIDFGERSVQDFFRLEAFGGDVAAFFYF
jgi:hypothetical protein